MRCKRNGDAIIKKDLKYFDNTILYIFSFIPVYYLFILPTLHLNILILHN
jgi:hypothetical protein